MSAPALSGLSALLLVLATGAVVAQDITSENYAETRGWLIKSASDHAGFAGCWGVSQASDVFLSLALMRDGWEVWLPSNATEGFAGGVITVDGMTVDSQFGFWPESGAFATLSAELAAAISQGSTLSFAINDDLSGDYTLT
jgi:hypothetical protein